MVFFPCHLLSPKQSLAGIQVSRTTNAQPILISSYPTRSSRCPDLHKTPHRMASALRRTQKTMARVRKTAWKSGQVRTHSLQSQQYNERKADGQTLPHKQSTNERNVVAKAREVSLQILSLENCSFARHVHRSSVQKKAIRHAVKRTRKSPPCGFTVRPIRPPASPRPPYWSRAMR